MFLHRSFASPTVFIWDKETLKDPFYSSGYILNAFSRAWEGFPFEQALPTERQIFFLPNSLTILRLSNGRRRFTICGAFSFSENPINKVFGILVVRVLII